MCLSLRVGSGTSISEKDKCKTCKGKKTISKEKELEVQVSAGMQPGQKIKFHGDANEAPGAETGDIVVILVPKDDDDEVPHFYMAQGLTCCLMLEFVW